MRWVMITIVAATMVAMPWTAGPAAMTLAVPSLAAAAWFGWAAVRGQSRWEPTHHALMASTMAGMLLMASAAAPGAAIHGAEHSGLPLLLGAYFLVSGEVWLLAGAHAIGRRCVNAAMSTAMGAALLLAAH